MKNHYICHGKSLNLFLKFVQESCQSMMNENPDTYQLFDFDLLQGQSSQLYFSNFKGCKFVHMKDGHSILSQKQNLGSSYGAKFKTNVT